MPALFQQLALQDALLSNWGVIRMQIGTTSPALEEELARIAARLFGVRSSDEIARGH